MNAPHPPPGQLTIVDEHAADGPQLLRQLHHDVLGPSFPPEEYIPPADGELDDPGPYLIACAEDGTVAGGALGELYPRSDSLLLSYLAARPGWRGHKVGSLLLDAVFQRWIGPRTLAFVEIEDPRHPRHDAAGVAAYGDPAARVRFYSRFPVSAICAPYFQPGLGAGAPRAYHLLLCVLGVPEEMRAEGGIASAPVLRFLEEYFTVCEEGAPADAQARWLLDAYRAPVLPLVPLADFWRVPDPPPPGR
jgi:GNAT superfamily N-acetyltransferase